MKKLFKLLVFAAMAGAASWLLRERVLAGPQSSPVPPAGSRNPPQAPEPAPDRRSAPDAEVAGDLTFVKGIGPVYATRLSESNIRSLSDLADADAAALAALTGLREEQIADWIDKAAKLD